MQPTELKKIIKKVLVKKPHLISVLLNEQAVPEQEPFDPTFGSGQGPLAPPSVPGQIKLQKPPKAPPKKISTEQGPKGIEKYWEKITADWAGDFSSIPEKYVREILESDQLRMLFDKQLDTLLKHFTPYAAERIKKRRKKQSRAYDKRAAEELRKKLIEEAMADYRKNPMPKSIYIKLVGSVTAKRPGVPRAAARGFWKGLKSQLSWGLIIWTTVYWLEDSPEVPGVEYDALGEGTPWKTILAPLDFFLRQHSSILTSKVKYYDPVHMSMEFARALLNVGGHCPGLNTKQCLLKRDRLQKELIKRADDCEKHRKKNWDAQLGQWKPGYREGLCGQKMRPTERNFPCVFRARTRYHMSECGEQADIFRKVYPRDAKKLDAQHVKICDNGAKILEDIWKKWKKEIMADIPESSQPGREVGSPPVVKDRSPPGSVPRELLYGWTFGGQRLTPSKPAFTLEQTRFALYIQRYLQNSLPRGVLTAKNNVAVYNFAYWIEAVGNLCRCKPKCSATYYDKKGRLHRHKSNKARWNHCWGLMRVLGSRTALNHLHAQMKNELEISYKKYKKGEISRKTLDGKVDKIRSYLFAMAHNGYRDDSDGCGAQFFPRWTGGRPFVGDLNFFKSKPEKPLHKRDPWEPEGEFTSWNRALALLARSGAKPTAYEIIKIKRFVREKMKRKWEQENLVVPGRGPARLKGDVDKAEYWCSSIITKSEQNMINAIKDGPKKGFSFPFRHKMPRRGEGREARYIQADAGPLYNLYLKKFTKNFNEGKLFKENEACMMRLFKMLLKARWDAESAGHDMSQWKDPSDPMMRSLFGHSWEAIKHRGLNYNEYEAFNVMKAMHKAKDEEAKKAKEAEAAQKAAETEKKVKAARRRFLSGTGKWTR